MYYEEYRGRKTALTKHEFYAYGEDFGYGVFVDPDRETLADGAYRKIERLVYTLPNGLRLIEVHEVMK